MKTNKILMLIIFLILLTFNLKSEDNKYDIYSKGINYVLHDFQKTFDTTYSEYFFISEIDWMGEEILKPIQNEHYKKIKKFSNELALNFKNNKMFSKHIQDSLILDFPHEFLPEKTYIEYIAKEYKYNTWDIFYKAHRIGAIISLSEISYNKKKDKAAYLIFF